MMLQEIPRAELPADRETVLLDLRVLFAISTWNSSWFSRRDRPWIERIQKTLIRCMEPTSSFVLKERALDIVRFVLISENRKDSSSEQASAPQHSFDEGLCSSIARMTASSEAVERGVARAAVR
jgi:hypothetical protein